jgi:hypothetical protein
MNLEINLWHRPRQDNYKAILNVNQRQVVQQALLMPTEKFCDYAFHYQNIDKQIINEIIKDPSIGPKTFCGFTKEHSLITWNTNQVYCRVIYNKEGYKLYQNKIFRAVKNMPDVCFRQIV